MKNLLYLLGLLAFSFNFSACSPEEPEQEPDPLKDFTLIDQLSQDAYSVSLYRKDNLYTGYNALYFQVTKDDDVLNDVDLSVTPFMEMTMHSHSAPVEQASGTADELGLHRAHVIFQMPSMNGSWFIKTQLNIDGKELAFDFPVEVMQPEFSTVHVKMGIDSMRYIVALASPSVPVVGENELDIVVYHMANMMQFDPIKGLKVRFEPTMPSMGHGSEGNIQPTEIEGTGHYKGTVVFNMTGDWRITYTILRDDAELLEEAYFDLYFQ